MALAVPEGVAAHDAANNANVVVLEAAAPARPGDQVAGCSAAQARAALDELALLHGSRWGDPDLLGSLGSTVKVPATRPQSPRWCTRRYRSSSRVTVHA